ncbi:MAG: hypothetical protein Q8L22_27050 [Reyranella sp.]|nr:hypothetical protein [Reyranella sp.]
MFIRATLLSATALLAAVEAGAQSGVGYKSVAEARNAVTALPGAKASEQQGWLIVKKMPVMWSFAPAGHEAYPTAVKRTVGQRDGSFDIDMSVLCEAPKPACDRLVEGFKSLNDQMKRNLGGAR